MIVCTDETLVKVAEREMKGIVPLYYEMAKAESTPINSDNVYTSLTSAYKTNIGIISNDITKIWNSDEPSLNAVKWLTMYNNFTIDYAKTLFLPTPPKSSENEIKSFTKNKLPHFFKYAKDKEDSQVSELNNSVVNKLHKIIPNKRITFKTLVGDVDYKKLMRIKSAERDEKVIEMFKHLEYQKNRWMSSSTENNELKYNDYVRSTLLELNDDVYHIVDSLVLYLYIENSRFKNGLWNVFGDILYDNLLLNLGNTIACEKCNCRTEKINELTIYCDPCAKEIEKMNKKERNKRYYKNSKKN